MVLRLTADQPGQISFDARLDRPERFETVGDGKNGLLMTGQLDNGVDGKGVRYAARVRVLNQGGEVSVHGNVLSVSKANEVVLLIAAATDYQGFAGRQTKDPLAATLDDLNKAARKSYQSLRKAHIADYQKYFERVSLHLEPANADEANQPTPKRIEWAAKWPGDPESGGVVFQFWPLPVDFLIATGRIAAKSSRHLGGGNSHAVEWRLASGRERGNELLAGGSLQSFGSDPAALCADCLVCKSPVRKPRMIITTRAAGWRTSSRIRGASLRRANPLRGVRPPAVRPGCASICGIIGCSRATENSCNGLIRS